MRQPQPRRRWSISGWSLETSVSWVSEAAWGEAIFFEISDHLVSFIITRLVVVIVPNKPTLAILAFHEPPGDALRGARGRGVGGSGKSTKCYHWVPLYSHAWIASQPPETRIARWGCVEGARRGCEGALGPQRVGLVWRPGAGPARGGAHSRRVGLVWGPSTGLRGSAMPGVEHGRGINDTNPESGRRRERASGAKNPPVRSCPELRECTNEPGAHRVARNA